MSCSVAAGNPIDASSGNKFQRERDFVGVGSVDLRFERVYNSHWSAPSGNVGVNWRTNFDRSMLINGNLPIVRMLRATGRLIAFKKLDGAWRPEPGETSTLVEFASPTLPQATWAFTTTNDEVEYYDRIGRLIQIKARGASVQRLEYDSQDRLKKVTDAFGHTLNFTYGFDERLATMQMPDGGTFTYGYDRRGNLVSVTGPERPVPVTRRYLYENANLPNALTGIEDENGKRYATWKYDSQGRAYHSEHADGVERTTLAYAPDGSTTITDALESRRTLTFEKVLGASEYSGETQPAGAGCDAAFRSALFDADGNVKSATDFNGIQTIYGYEKRRRLTTLQIEAFGRAEQRTTTTEWHPDYRLPKRIAAPLQITTFDYFPNGQLKARSVQATKDETGAQAFSATPFGPTSAWTYTYNVNGQVETITGPRLGGIDKTIYTYDLVTGDLQSIKNAENHLTTFGDYDANGRPGLITAPNGMTTRMTFTPRGLLETQTVSDGVRVLTTSFAYDTVGQLKTVTMPDKSYLTYTYDDAHRLTDVIDSDGNTIHYVLNKLGSREREEVRDPTGVLKRRLVRHFDALNRVDSETGGAQ